MQDDSDTRFSTFFFPLSCLLQRKKRVSIAVRATSRRDCSGALLFEGKRRADFNLGDKGQEDGDVSVSLQFRIDN